MQLSLSTNKKIFIFILIFCFCGGSSASVELTDAKKAWCKNWSKITQNGTLDDVVERINYQDSLNMRKSMPNTNAFYQGPLLLSYENSFEAAVQVAKQNSQDNEIVKNLPIREKPDFLNYKSIIAFNSLLSENDNFAKDVCNIWYDSTYGKDFLSN